MNSISPPITLIKKICKYQRYVESVTYRATNYCIAVECPDGMLMYNTLTGELLLLSREEYAVRETDAALREALVRHWFLVPDQYNEKTYAEQVFRLALLMDHPKKSLNSFLIFTTLDCNARCFYCYEMGRARSVMSRQTALDTAEFIAKSCEGEPVSLQWFGGEPLFNYPVIDTITNELKKRNIEYGSFMTSNGYLFHQELIQKASEEWRLHSIQITLDGTEEIYIRTKAYIHRGENPYQRVLRNIGMLLDAGIRVIVRMNLNSQNADDLSALVEELYQRFREKKGLSVYMALLMQFTDRSVHGYDKDSDALNRMEMLTDRIREHKLALTDGIQTSIHRYCCMADNDRAVTILPDGHLGRCEHESEDGFIGTIYEGVTDQELVKAWKVRLSCPECDECPVYPICQTLEKCEWNSQGCSDITRGKQRILLKQRVLNTYEKWKAENEIMKQE